MRGMGELMFLFRFPPKVSAQPRPTEDRLLLPHHHPRSVCGSVPAVTRRGVGGKGAGDRGCPVPPFSASSRGGGGGGEEAASSRAPAGGTTWLAGVADVTWPQGGAPTVAPQPEGGAAILGVCGRRRHFGGRGVFGVGVAVLVPVGCGGRALRGEEGRWSDAGLGRSLGSLGPRGVSYLLSLRTGAPLLRWTTCAVQKCLLGKRLKQNVLWESRASIKICLLKQRCDGTGQLQTSGVHYCQDQLSWVL